MTEQETFGERLKKARELRKLTQIELGEKAVIPSTSVAHFEANSRKPSFDSLKKLAVALDVTTDFLLGRVDDFAVSEKGDALFRDIKNLSANDRKLAEDFMKILAGRNVNNDKKN